MKNIFIYIISVISIIFTIFIYRTSNLLNDRQFAVIQEQNRVNKFIAKHDTIRVLSPFIKAGLIEGPPDLFKQGYLYYLVLGEKILTDEELDAELSKVNSVEDYEKIIELSRLDSKNTLIIELHQDIEFFRKKQNLFFLVLMITQILNTVFVLRLAQVTAKN